MLNAMFVGKDGYCATSDYIAHVRVLQDFDGLEDSLCKLEDQEQYCRHYDGNVTVRKRKECRLNDSSNNQPGKDREVISQDLTIIISK